MDSTNVSFRFPRSWMMWALLAVWSSMTVLSVEGVLRGARTEQVLPAFESNRPRQRFAMEDKKPPQEVAFTLKPTELPKPTDFPTPEPSKQKGDAKDDEPKNPPDEDPPDDVIEDEDDEDDQRDDGDEAVNNIDPNVYSLLSFSMTIEGSLQREESILRYDLEEYLAAEMSSWLDRTVEISLDIGSRRLQQQQRSLQQTATRLEYEGTATFVNGDGTGVENPTDSDLLFTKNQVELAQILALENTSLLQQYLDVTSSNPVEDSVVIISVAVSNRDPVQASGQEVQYVPTSIEKDSSVNGKGGTVAGVIAAVCVLVVVVICFLVFRYVHNKPPPPPPLECEIIPDISEVDGDAKLDPNMEMVLKAPAANGDKQNNKRVFGARNVRPPSNGGSSGGAVDGENGGSDDETAEDDGSPNSLNKTASRTEGDGPAAKTKMGFFARLSGKSLYSDPVVDMTRAAPEPKWQHQVEISPEDDSMEGTNVTFGWTAGEDGEAILRDLTAEELAKGIPPTRTSSMPNRERSFDSSRMATIKSVLSNDEESMAGYSLATDVRSTGQNLTSPPTNQTSAQPSSPTPGMVLNRWFSGTREFLSERKPDDPTTSDSESARSGVQQGNMSVVSQIGLSAAMNSPNPLLAAEYFDESVEVGQPELFLDDDEDDDEEIYNSSYKEEDNIRGDSSVLSELLSQASDMDGVYTTAGSTIGEDASLSLPPRTHHPGGVGVGVSLYRASPSGEGFRTFEMDGSRPSSRNEVVEPAASFPSPHKVPSYDEIMPSPNVTYQRNVRSTQQADTHSDVPSDELNATKGGVEQDLSGFEENTYPRISSPVNSWQTSGSQRSDYRYQDNHRAMVNERQHHIRHELNTFSTPERPSYSGRTTTTRSSRGATSDGYPQSPDYPSYSNAPACVSPTSTASYTSGNGSLNDADYDASVQHFIKERRRIKRATRKHRAERKQPPVTMEV